MSRKKFEPKPVVKREVVVIPSHFCSLCKEVPGVVEIEMWENQWKQFCLPCGGSMQSVLRDSNGQESRVRSMDPSRPVPNLPPPVVDRSNVLYKKVEEAPKPPKPMKSVIIVAPPTASSPLVERPSRMETPPMEDIESSDSPGSASGMDDFLGF